MIGNTLIPFILAPFLFSMVFSFLSPRKTPRPLINLVLFLSLITGLIVAAYTLTSSKLPIHFTLMRNWLEVGPHHIALQNGFPGRCGSYSPQKMREYRSCSTPAAT